MTALSGEEMEGRLNAHRELMIDFIAALLGGEESIQSFTNRLAQDASISDHEEDPGAMPGTGFAIQNSASEEIRSILEAARARARANQRKS